MEGRVGLFIALAAVALAWAVLRPTGDRAQAVTISSTRDGLEREAASARASGSSLSFAIGLNAAVDLIVSATEFMEAAKMPMPTSAESHEAVNSHQEFVNCFAHHFALGSAAERWYGNQQEYDEMVKIAKTLKSAKFFTGGNAALMAQHIAETSSTNKVMLVADVGPELQSLVSKNIIVDKSCSVADDEVHLILEYKKGEQWAGATAGRSNRFIMSHDKTNAELRALPKFRASLQHVPSDVVVLSGAHMLEGQPPAVKRERLQDIVKFMNELPPSKPLHLELASIGDKSFIKDIASNVLPHAISIGLNEQELSAFAIANNGPHQDRLAKPFNIPDVGLMADLMFWVFSLKVDGQPSRLSRIHMHSLSYHITAVRRGRWTGVKAATAMGSLVCSKRACESDSLSASNVHLLFPTSYEISFETPNAKRVFDPNHPVVEWVRDDIEFTLAPVLVCNKPTKTVGLGDAISATGLQFSSYVPA
eukprot:m.88358 g.88358  ORF g.88358 m.88358 type:complete len:478 (+) comp15181_c0_seq1:159-1592(+)